MLAKINEMNKNVVILLSVLIIALTSIIVTLIATGDARKGSANSITEFQEYFTKEYGVKPEITVDVKSTTEEQAKTITESASKKLGLGETSPITFEDGKWYHAENDTKKIRVTAHYK